MKHASRIAVGMVGALLAGIQSCRTDDVVLLEIPANAGAAVSDSGQSSLEGGGSTTSGRGGAPSGGRNEGGDAIVFGGSPNGGNTAGTGVSGAGEGSQLSGGGPGTQSVCKTDADCPDSWLCDKQDCSASTGTCEPRPVLCPPDPMPVCGCDHVTYWNVCIRVQSGVSASTPGECRAGAIGCSSAADCGLQGAFCARLLQPGQMCTPSAVGTCWVMPPACADRDPMRWAECPPPMGAEGMQQIDPPACVDTCTAILSERPHIRLPPHADCRP